MPIDTLGYDKWKNLNYESDEEDCHPNIEINTWRRLKERQRHEKGEIKKEVVLNDKWNTTSVNTKKKDERIDKSIDKQESNIKKYEEPELIGNDGIPEHKRYMYKKEAPTKEKIIESNPYAKKYNYQPTTELPKDKKKTDDKDKDNNTNDENKENTNKKTTSKKEEVEEEPFKARSNPSEFLENHLTHVKKYAKIKDDTKADEYIIKNPELVHEAAEGFLITYAVDRAVEGADTREIERLAKRTLTIHNLVASCQSGNIKPELGVKMFYTKLSMGRFKNEYAKELYKQTKELMFRIEQRRIERIKEAEEKMKNGTNNENEIIEEEINEDERAQVGPGGLDPTEVLNSLPKPMQDAFLSREIDKLKEAMLNMTQDEANYHFQRCIDSGLWVADRNEEHQTVEVDLDKVNSDNNNNNNNNDKEEQDDDEEEEKENITNNTDNTNTNNEKEQTSSNTNTNENTEKNDKTEDTQEKQTSNNTTSVDDVD